MTEPSRLGVAADLSKAKFDLSLARLRQKLSAKGLADELLRQIESVKPGMAQSLVRSSREEPVRALSFAAIAALFMCEALRSPKRGRSSALTRRHKRTKGD